MGRFLNRVGREIRELLPVWLFFFLAFSLLRLTQSVTLHQFGLHSTTPSLVLLGSLIVAKSFLILDRFSFVERFRHKPLIYGVLWKSVIYYCGAFIIYFLEQLIELALKHQSVNVAWDHLSSASSTSRFWIIQLWLFLLLFAYTGARETAQAFGKQRFIRVWFGGSHASATRTTQKAA